MSQERGFFFFFFALFSCQQCNLIRVCLGDLPSCLEPRLSVAASAHFDQRCWTDITELSWMDTIGRLEFGGSASLQGMAGPGSWHGCVVRIVRRLRAEGGSPTRTIPLRWDQIGCCRAAVTQQLHMSSTRARAGRCGR
ncbi:hypothetical protein BDP55DRAFT_148525 [Colletotrichum godetiae]|uniref:Secreted protein n=1 Tax=Colletotrichum godetiae TaxID=1209918 RepID=A0AAJ0AKU4_9PEZI|nr:uncharacterized protein BDP55DRAFT_148525 [Colletotrichum godetiae]KAK1675732.1 hypothetical protein BDP55DRAFT_148525 [Colletotrichum godetiae]